LLRQTEYLGVVFMPCARSTPAPHLLLIKSNDFAGWVCSHCAWQWRLEERASDQMLAGDPMRQAFASHRCEDFTGDMEKLARTRACLTAWIRDIRTEERIASLIAAASMVWAVNLVTNNFAGVANIPALPQELTGTCAIATLIWIHAKWRRAVQSGLIPEPMRVGV
jgi:hypothetical protein